MLHQDDEKPLVTLQQAAARLLPLEWGDWALGGCARCGAPTAAYQRLADRGMVPICGDCYSEDMLHAIKDIREQRQRE